MMGTSEELGPSDAGGESTVGTVAPTPLVHGLRWGLKASFIDYVRRMPDGRGAVGDGAVPVGEADLFFELDHPLDGRTGWKFRGDVRFTGHFGMLFIRIARPQLDLDGDTLVLTIEDPAGDPEAPRIPLVTGTLRHVDAQDATAIWVSEDVNLTAAGVELFNDVYAEGEPFASLVLQVPADHERFASCCRAHCNDV